MKIHILGKKDKTKRGFTLLEVIMAIGIMAIGILTIMAVFSAALSTNKIGDSKTTAYSLGERKMEELISLIEQDQWGNYPAAQGPTAFQNSPNFLWQYWMNQTQIPGIGLNGVTPVGVTLRIWWPAGSLPNQRKFIEIHGVAVQVANI